MAEVDMSELDDKPVKLKKKQTTKRNEDKENTNDATIPSKKVSSKFNK